MPEREEVVVIGGGPAGMAAAIQLKRSGFDPLLVERDEMGGLLWNAHWIENYPGFPSGITGPELVGLFTEQTRGAGVRTAGLDVERLRRFGDGFRIEAGNRTIDARAVAVASGTVPRRLPPDLLAECDAARVFYEVKDLPQDKRNRIAIIGGGDAAFDYALGLAQRGSRVEIFFRSGHAKALPLLVKRARREALIGIRADAAVTAITNGDGTLELALSAGEHCEADAVLVAIGRDRSIGFLEQEILREIDLSGPDSIPGLAIAGDVLRGHHRQVAIAAGDGVAAGMKIAAFLSS